MYYVRLSIILNLLIPKPVRTKAGEGGKTADPVKIGVLVRRLPLAAWALCPA